MKEKTVLAQLPIDLPVNYLHSVNEILKEETLTNVRNSVNKGRPYGKSDWIDKMVEDHNLEHTVRECGRPRKN